MSKELYMWYWDYGSQPETYSNGPFLSHGEAVANARGEDAHEDERGFTVIEARKSTLRFDAIDADDVLNRVFDHNEDLWGEDGVPDVPAATVEQDLELQAALALVIEGWMTKHGLLPHVWAFAHMRNEEYFAPTGDQTNDQRQGDSG